MRIKNQNILVTGGTGFVGSHLVEELIDKGANIFTTYLENDPFSYFSTKGMDKKTVMINADVEDYEKILDVITKNDISLIFHLAAQALVEPAYHNPKRTLSTNIMGTVNVLEAARLYPKIKGVIIASSDKAYGKLKNGKYKEGQALKGDHPYEVSKSAADLVAHGYYKTYDLPVVITRFGNIYGEGDLNFSRIIPGTIISLIKDELLEIRSNGKFVRDYLYVKDVVNGYLMLAEDISRVKGEAFNFGSDETLSVMEVVRTLEKNLNRKVNYKILNTARNEIPYQSLDYSKVKKVLGWEPTFSLDTTIKKTYEWYARQHLQRYLDHL